MRQNRSYPSLHPAQKELQILTVRDFMLSFLEPLAYIGLIAAQGRIRRAYRSFLRGRRADRDRLSKLLYALKQRKLIIDYHEEKERFIELTPEGKKKILRLLVSSDVTDTRSLKDSKRWDKKWHLVAFDVPEKYRDGRDVLRSTLKRFGFVKLQKSLFVSPLDYRAEIEVVREIYGVKPYVLSIVADDLEGADHLIRSFSGQGVIPVV